MLDVQMVVVSGGGLVLAATPVDPNGILEIK